MQANRFCVRTSATPRPSFSSTHSSPPPRKSPTEIAYWKLVSKRSVTHRVQSAAQTFLNLVRKRIKRLPRRALESHCFVAYLYVDCQRSSWSLPDGMAAAHRQDLLPQAQLLQHATARHEWLAAWKSSSELSSTFAWAVVHCVCFAARLECREACAAVSLPELLHPQHPANHRSIRLEKNPAALEQSSHPPGVQHAGAVLETLSFQGPRYVHQHNSVQKRRLLAYKQLVKAKPTV